MSRDALCIVNWFLLVKINFRDHVLSNARFRNQPSIDACQTQYYNSQLLSSSHNITTGFENP